MSRPSESPRRRKAGRSEWARHKVRTAKNARRDVKRRVIADQQKENE